MRRYFSISFSFFSILDFELTLLLRRVREVWVKDAGGGGDVGGGGGVGGGQRQQLRIFGGGIKGLCMTLSLAIVVIVICSISLFSTIGIDRFTFDQFYYFKVNPDS